MPRRPSIVPILLLLASVVLPAQGQGPLGDGQAQVPNDLTHAMAMSAKGALAIRAVQGTKDGPAVGGEDVEVVIFHRDRPVQQINGKLDEHGLLVIGDLPVSIGIRALVRVRHAGVLYQDAAPPMDESRPEASVDITVYEVTDEPQPWRIIVRQLAAALVPNGIDVAETVVVENQGDRTWLGEPADADGRRATVRLTLPPDAVEVELLQGFHGWCCSQYTPPTLTVQMPVMPGQHTFRFAYKIPVRSGMSDLRVASGAPTDRSVFVVPASGVVASGHGAEQTGAETIGGVQTVRFEGRTHETGALVGLTLTEVALPTAPGASGALPVRNQSGGGSSGSIPTWVIGAAVVGAVVAALFALRKKGVLG